MGLLIERGVEEGGVAETLFEADDAVLILKRVGAYFEDCDEEEKGHDDPPEMGA